MSVAKAMPHLLLEDTGYDKLAGSVGRGLEGRGRGMVSSILANLYRPRP
jgi:hypothetical protein